MNTLMNTKTVRNILSTFYEGFFEEFSASGKDINFKLECSYLADFINPGSRYFYGTFKNVTEFYFIPWEAEFLEITSLSELESFKLDILGAEYFDDKVKIYSNCCHSYTGGNLFIRALEVKVYDENFERVNPEMLQEIAESYWDSVNKY